MTAQQDVLDFWFQVDIGDDLETHKNYWARRMRGGADDEIIGKFGDTTNRASGGEYDDWSETPHGRLALIVVLDQFPRSLWRDTAAAYAQDEKALVITMEGFDNGDFNSLVTPWEKVFFLLPLIHCEGPDHLARLDRAVELGRQILGEAPVHLRPLYEFSVQQAEEHRNVVATYGRHPHRNVALGRESTPEELIYIEKGAFPHLREMRIEG